MEAPVKVRIEEYTGNNGITHESVRFIGAATGQESFRLGEQFIQAVEGTDGRPVDERFCLCAGTAGRWDSCHVSREELAAYLRAMRPALFASSESSRP